MSPDLNESSIAPHARPRRVAALLVALIAAAGFAALAAPGADAERKKTGVKPVLYVGNNWEGTADIIQPRGKFKRLARLNIIPDIDERMMEIYLNPIRLGYFLAIRELVGEGNDQFVDDMFSSKDGRVLFVSRPSLADVVAIRIKTGEILWRFVVDGQRSDHMAISPDGKQLAVSASTGNVVHIVNTKTGLEVDRFDSGDSPHENNYSKNGKRLFHASIGMVYTPADDPLTDSTKGERVFQIVRTRDYKVLKTVNMGAKLAQAGYPQMSAAVRPMAISPDERFVYLQVSFFHGFVEYDLRKHKVTRLARLPVAAGVEDIPKEQYLLDSAHHGIAMNRKGTKLCVAGTMSDYAAIVSRKSFKFKRFNSGLKPYWSTNSGNGKLCFVSFSGSDRVSVYSYRKRKEIARIQVGDHPQRIRMGRARRGWLRQIASPTRTQLRIPATGAAPGTAG